MCVIEGVCIFTLLGTCAVEAPAYRSINTFGITLPTIRYAPVVMSRAAVATTNGWDDVSAVE